MAEETKSPAPTPDPAGKPSGSVEPVPPANQPSPSAVPKPASPPPAAAKPAPPPAAPAKPAGPVPVAWDSPLVASLKRTYGSGIREASTYLGQNYIVVDSAAAMDVLNILRQEQEFDYCVDITAVHHPQREKQFDLIWILYSFAKNERLRVKTEIADGQPFATSTSIWPTANWLEREVFDMFGITFDGHPDMKRILLPDGWKGHPLRKDYGIIQQDKEWVQINLGIESGQ
jgi:NADH-quinone oxidoreductase subunit C